MNYLELILLGFTDTNTSKYLDHYFLRQCKKAVESHYSNEEFFEGCMNAINELKGLFKDQLDARKSEINKLLQHTTGQQREDILQELKDLKPDDFLVNYNRFKTLFHDHGLRGNLYYHDLATIQTALNSAHLTLFGKSLIDKNYGLLETYKKIELKNPDEYTAYKKVIIEEGSIGLKVDNQLTEAYVFTLELVLLFLQTEIEVKDRATKEFTNIRTIDYSRTFIKGFKVGQKDFIDTYKYDPQNTNTLVLDLKKGLYELDFGGNKKGWTYVKSVVPFTLNHETIWNYGHASGCLYEVEKLFHVHKSFYNQFVKYMKPEMATAQKEENPLESIWLKNPKITIQEALEKGYNGGIWNESHTIQTKRGSLYGTGKSLLSALYVSLKDNSIKETIDYKVVGEAMCRHFKIEVKPETAEPYKPFQRANPKIVTEFKKLFKLPS